MSVRLLCPDCNTAVPRATLVEVDGRVYLDVDGVMVAAGWRHCHCCGRKIHWKASKMALAELEARQTERLAQVKGE